MTRLPRVHSIRLRLAAATAAVVAGAGLVFGVSSFLLVRGQLEGGNRAFAHHEALEVASVVASLRTPEEVRARHAELERLLPEEGVMALQVWSTSGELVYSLADEGVPAPAPWPEGFREALSGNVPFQAVALPDGRRGTRTAMLVSYQREPRWLVTAEVNASQVEATLAEYVRTFALGLGVAVLVVFLGSLALLSLGLRPVLSLVEDARAITTLGPHRRLAEPPPGSELGELARVLNLMLDRTEETLAQLGRFTAHAGHELRTPLTRMRGEAEAALRQDDAPSMREALGSILEELDGLRRLVDALLELARGERAELHGAAPLDLAEVTRSLAGEARALGEARGVTVVGPDAHVRAPVHGNRDLLARALWNVLDNALKYVPAGGHVEVGVEVQDGVEGGHVRVAVSDDGPGLPAQEGAAERLFEPFSRPPGRPTADAPAGHGVGLALARTIARRHGGDLTAANVVPRGARFTLALALAPAEQALASAGDRAPARGAV